MNSVSGLCHAGLCLNLSDALGGGKDSINHLDFYGPTVSFAVIVHTSSCAPPTSDHAAKVNHVQPSPLPEI